MHEWKNQRFKCFHRWLELTNDSFQSKGAWTKEEDEILRQLVREFGARNWSTVANSLPGRIGSNAAKDGTIILIHASEKRNGRQKKTRSFFKCMNKLATSGVK